MAIHKAISDTHTDMYMHYRGVRYSLHTTSTTTTTTAAAAAAAAATTATTTTSYIYFTYPWGVCIVWHGAIKVYILPNIACTCCVALYTVSAGPETRRY